MIGTLPEPRRLTLAPIRLGGDILDRGLVAWLPAPHSFTGEDCAELQVHGSPAVVRAILRAAHRAPGCPSRRSRRVHPPRLRERQARPHRGRRPRRSHRGRDREAAPAGAARLAGGCRRQGRRVGASGCSTSAPRSKRGSTSPTKAMSASCPRASAKAIAALRSELRGRHRIGRRAAASSARASGSRWPARPTPASPACSMRWRGPTSRSSPTSRAPRATCARSLDLGGQLVILVDMAGLRETDSKAEAEGVRRAAARSRRPTWCCG